MDELHGERSEEAGNGKLEEKVIGKGWLENIPKAWQDWSRVVLQVTN